MADMRFFRCGTRAIAISEVSHWWVAPDAIGGPALCFSMRNGKQINFGPEDFALNSDAYATEEALVTFLQKING